jgi:hypothetical protein
MLCPVCAVPTTGICRFEYLDRLLACPMPMSSWEQSLHNDFGLDWRPMRCYRSTDRSTGPMSQGNFNPHRGTLRLLVRGSVWQDTQTRWLFEARSKSFIGIRHTPGVLSLVVRQGRLARQEVSHLDLPIQEWRLTSGIRWRRLGTGRRARAGSRWTGAA